MVEDVGVWKSLLKADATEWLLEENNPSVRYFALTVLICLDLRKFCCLDKFLRLTSGRVCCFMDFS
jgi:hypothetical protein